MKKILSIILAVVICMSCVGCGTKGINKTVYDSGIRAIEVFDSYWDMEISEDDAKEKLDVLKERVDSVSDNGGSNIAIATDILHLSICIGFDDDEGLEVRNKLAKELGQPKK